MNHEVLNTIISLGGTFALLTLGFAVVKILSVLRQFARVNQTPRLTPSRTIQGLVITACVIAMLCAAARAWQLTLLGR